MDIYGKINIYLKPCPFCGKKVEMHYYEENYPFTFTDNGYVIECKKCRIKKNGSLGRLPEADRKQAEIVQRKLADWWNNRKEKK